MCGAVLEWIAQNRIFALKTGGGFTGFTRFRGKIGIDQWGVIDWILRLRRGGFRVWFRLRMSDLWRLPTPDPSRLREGGMRVLVLNERWGGGASGGEVWHAGEAMSGGGL